MAVFATSTAVRRPGLPLSKSSGSTYSDPRQGAGSGEAPGEVSVDSIRAQLERILKSEVFVRSERLSRFLQFVVEERLAGRSEQLKEYVIGVEVYGRDKSFDSTLDSIVRVEAHRLRSSLAKFYEIGGKDDPVEIEVPKGQYAPVFRKRQAKAPSLLSPGSVRHERTLAVLPFENLSSDEDQKYFCDGITEELINALTHLEGLHVVARTSAFAFKGSREDVRTIGKALNVGRVIEGSVRKSGDKLRITAQLIDVADGYHLWSGRYDRRVKDIFAIQDDIARAIVKALRIRLEAELSGPLVNKYTDNLEAYQLFLRGLYHWHRQTKEGIRRGCDCFERAVECDPNHVPAYVGISDCYRLLAFWGMSPPREVMPKAKAAALKALEIDDTHSGARRAMAAVRGHSWEDWPRAEDEYIQAIRVNPGDAITRISYAVVCLAPMGRLDEAAAQMEIANELDPVSPFQKILLGWMCYFGRHHNQAIKHSQQALELDPNSHLAYLALGWAYEQKLVLEEAVAAFEKARSLASDIPLVLGSLGHSYALAGRTAEAGKLLRELSELSKERYVSSLEAALIYTGLQQKDEALERLEEAYSDHTLRLILLGVDPRFDPLRSELRFIAILNRMGLSGSSLSAQA